MHITTHKKKVFLCVKIQNIIYEESFLIQKKAPL